MLKFIPGNTYIVALLIQTQTDPTIPPTPASGLTPVSAFITDAPLGAAVVTADSVIESGTYPLPDGTTAAKYLATFSGGNNLMPLSLLMGQEVYVYGQYGADLLEPQLGIILASPDIRR